MLQCRKCRKEIPQGTKYCSYCATPVIEETFICPSCGSENDLSAHGCSNCGFRFSAGKEETKVDANDIFDTSQMQGLQQEVADIFSLHFENRLKEEHHPNLHGTYIDRFFKSEFRTSADYRIKQLTEVIPGLMGEKKDVEKEKREILYAAFEELIDYFTVRFCADLNETFFPEAILKYAGLEKSQTNLGQMVLDYLDFENEDESVYLDFVAMPAKKLKNAADSYLFPKKGETLFFICDLSLLGTSKDGFAMTNECIYWKTPLERKQQVFYKKLKEVKREEDWITINGIFFSANKSLNLKLIRLLKKLMVLEL